MQFLLKIVDGPMKGAEAALVRGLRIKVGSSDDCDIVIVDGSIPPIAFELDVAEESVSLILGGEVREMQPFVIESVGTTKFAIGPAVGEWEELHEAERGAADKADKSEAEATAENAEATPEPAPNDDEKVAEAATESGDDAKKDVANGENSRRRSCLPAALGLLLLLIAGGVALWIFRDNEQVVRAKNGIMAYREKWFGKSETEADAAAEHKPTLAEIAAKNNLELRTIQTDGTDRPLLCGNFKCRTERMAIRDLARATDPAVEFELTDDETLRKSADELLFVITEGQLKAVKAENRVVTLNGYAKNSATLERIIRALNADVKNIERLITDTIQIGGQAPIASENGNSICVEEEAPPPKAPRSHGTKTDDAKDYPIAGILVSPYPCVVMRNGMRVAEGADIGGAVIEKIEAGRLVLRNGGTEFEWRP